MVVSFSEKKVFFNTVSNHDQNLSKEIMDTDPAELDSFKKAKINCTEKNNVKILIF